MILVREWALRPSYYSISSQCGRFYFSTNIIAKSLILIKHDSNSDLFDSYDQAARIYWGQEAGDQRLARAFVLAQIEEIQNLIF